MSRCLRRFPWKKRFAAEPINRSLPIPASSKLAETYFVKQELAAKRLWIGLEGPPDCSGPAQLIRCNSGAGEAGGAGVEEGGASSHVAHLKTTALQLYQHDPPRQA